MLKYRFILSSISSFVAATACGAQEFNLDKFGLETGVSALGFYIGPDYEINKNIRIRTPLYFGKFSQTFDVEGNDVDASLNLNSLHIMGDYYFGASGVRASTGLAFGGYSLEGTATNLTFDGTKYDGNFVAKMNQDKKVAPVFAIGYQHTFGDNWGFSAELGARITSVTLFITGQETLSASDFTKFETDLAEINRDLHDFNVIPFLSLAVSYRF